MEKRKVEIAIIGAGTAGLTAYSAARKQTDNIVLIEGDEYGTTRDRVGCMPSKLLIAAAAFLWTPRCSARPLSISGTCWPGPRSSE